MEREQIILGYYNNKLLQICFKVCELYVCFHSSGVTGLYQVSCVIQPMFERKEYFVFPSRFFIVFRLENIVFPSGCTVQYAKMIKDI